MPNTDARVSAPTAPTRPADANDRRAPGAAVHERTGGTAAPVDPYAAYTEQAEDYDYGTPDLDEVLPEFAVGLLAAAGRMLALLAYRDAFALGDRPLNRRSAKATATVFADLPAECDRRDRSWRLRWTRCLDDLAADLQAGRAPLPRCAGERWALQVMTDRAPHLLACSDAQLSDLGVRVPDDEDYRPPYWEGVVEAFVVDGAEYSISQARPGDDDEHEDPSVPDGGWDAPGYWFAPYGITAGRDPDRGHPRWVMERLDGAAAQPEGGFARAGELLAYPTRVDPWAAYTDEYRGVAEYRVLTEVLTPQAAALLVAPAQQLASIGYEEVISHGDEPLEREPDDDGGWYEQGFFLANLPPVCDRQHQPWRLAMVRALDDLAEDLRAGQAPLPRCFPGKLACCGWSCCADGTPVWGRFGTRTRGAAFGKLSVGFATLPPCFRIMAAAGSGRCTARLAVRRCRAVWCPCSGTGWTSMTARIGRGSGRGSRSWSTRGGDSTRAQGSRPVLPDALDAS